MTRVEAIAKLLAEHDFDNDRTHPDKGMYYCVCGAATDVYIEHHHAAVVDAWLAEQEREEWGVEFFDVEVFEDEQAASQAWERMHLNIHGKPIEVVKVVRRRVGEWEEA
jgi:hypothetical protein